MIMRPSNGRISHCKVISVPWAVSHAQPTPPGAAADRVSRQQASGDARGLCGRSAAGCGLRAWGDQGDALRVENAAPRRRGQDGIWPSLRGPEEAKEPGALGEVGNQHALAVCRREASVETPTAC